MRYQLEIVTKHGNKFRDLGNTTITEARKKACRYAKSEDAVVNIMRFDNYWHQIEFIFYDPTPESMYGFKPGYYLQIRGDGRKKGRRSRVSPKTGKPLAVSKEWKYL